MYLRPGNYQFSCYFLSQFPVQSNVNCKHWFQPKYREKFWWNFVIRRRILFTGKHPDYTDLSCASKSTFLSFHEFLELRSPRCREGQTGLVWWSGEKTIHKAIKIHLFDSYKRYPLNPRNPPNLFMFAALSLSGVLTWQCCLHGWCLFSILYFGIRIQHFNWWVDQTFTQNVDRTIEWLS